MLEINGINIGFDYMDVEMKMHHINALGVESFTITLTKPKGDELINDLFLRRSIAGFKIKPKFEPYLINFQGEINKFEVSCFANIKTVKIEVKVIGNYFREPYPPFETDLKSTPVFTTEQTFEFTGNLDDTDMISMTENLRDNGYSVIVEELVADENSCQGKWSIKGVK